MRRLRLLSHSTGPAWQTINCSAWQETQSILSGRAATVCARASAEHVTRMQANTMPEGVERIAHLQVLRSFPRRSCAPLHGVVLWLRWWIMGEHL